jgi:hypothetical protein
MIKRNSLGSKHVTSSQTKLEGEAYLAEGQFLLEEQKFNIKKFLMFLAGTLKSGVSKREGQNLKQR